VRNGRIAVFTVAIAGLIAATATPCRAGSHLWRFNEIFSNVDGTVQFIELKESGGSPGEHWLDGKWVLAVGAANQFTFPADITGDTSNRHLLLATAAFAALPGAPAPDYIIADGFLPTDGDTLEYWAYVEATWTYGPVELPIDGVLSLNANHTTGVNSPTNYAGDTGTIDVGVDPVPAASAWSLAVLLLVVLAAGTVAIRKGRETGFTA
jgi:hypothetical protein